jgi:hypothetical protein
MSGGLRACIVGALAALVMAAGLTTATAGRLSTSSQNIRITFNNFQFSAEGIGTDECRVTLEGSLHSRTVSKTAGLLVGYITRVTTGSCTLGTTVLTASLPWHVRYGGFNGTLPRLSGLFARVSRVSASFGALGFVCLAEGETETTSRRDTTTGAITEAEVPTQSIPLRSGGGFGCPEASGRLSSAQPGRPMVLGTTTLITITLI